jgi:hypothetical protein
MKLVLMLVLIVIISTSASAQQNNVYQSQNFRLGEAHYRVAEPTQIADTVLVWGDIVLPGTYIVPRGISLAQMIAYARGPINLRTQETDLDWSQVFVEISITNRDTGESLQLIQKVDGYNRSTNFFEKADAKLRHCDNYELEGNPTFLDYVRAYSPVIATVLEYTSISNNS